MTEAGVPAAPKPGDPMLAAFYEGPGRAAVRTVPVPAIGPGEALVQMQACGLCGSDALDWYMAPRAPFVFGHEPAGIVVAVGEGVTNFRPGDRVFVHHHAPCGNCEFCRRGEEVHCPTWRSTNLTPGGLAEYFRVPAVNLAHDTLPLPPDVSFAQGSLVEPVACGVKALDRAGIGPGTSVLIVGLGFMGQAMGYLCRQAGAGPLLGTDLVPDRLDRAKAWADHVLPAGEADPAPAGPAKDSGDKPGPNPRLIQQVREITGGHGVDVAVVVPAGEAALLTGIAAVRPNGRVVMFSPPAPEADIQLPLSDMFFREVTLIPSYSAGPDHTRRALKAVAEGHVPDSELITHYFPLDRIGEAYALLRDPRREALKIVVTPSSGGSPA
ncbi:MAG TPA: alcohol dehydrogenase catalytic domain-containing protein [Sphingobacteriaceae bacterium]|nr:alcohol dehydrogenase catalytic domain-containing protein [Sphingobacteriaceae bacterium]